MWPPAKRQEHVFFAAGTHCSSPAHAPSCPASPASTERHGVTVVFIQEKTRPRWQQYPRTGQLPRSSRDFNPRHALLHDWQFGRWRVWVCGCATCSGRKGEVCFCHDRFLAGRIVSHLNSYHDSKTTSVKVWYAVGQAEPHASHTHPREKKDKVQKVHTYYDYTTTAYAVGIFTCHKLLQSGKPKILTGRDFYLKPESISGSDE